MMIVSSFFFAISSVSVPGILLSVDAFVVPFPTAPSAVTLLHMETPSSGDSGEWDIEAARERFEEMMMSGGAGAAAAGGGSSDTPSHRGFDTSKIDKKSLSELLSATKPKRPLTSIGRERKQTEIQLLESLEKNDEIVDRLWSIWYNERGPLAAQELYFALELMDNRHWDQAEERLRALVSEHGPYWAEPINALATLKFITGRLEESRDLCLAVLREKPWHFGALSGIVMVYEGLHDTAKAQTWAAQRLPPLESPKRRRDFVQRAVRNANQALTLAEEQLQLYFGQQDRRNNNNNNKKSPSGPLDVLGGSWQ